MKKVSLLLLGFIFLTSNCSDPADSGAATDCSGSFDGSIKTKEQAETLILGSWNWVKSTRPIWGAEPKIETPESTGKEMKRVFFKDTVQFFENNNLLFEGLYEITYLGLNGAKEELAIKYYKLTGEYKSISPPLILSSSGRCMMFSGSYNDAGDDMTFVRAD